MDDEIQLAMIETVAFEKVVDFFGSEEKAQRWFFTPNPLLGGVSPDQMCIWGKQKKLLEFVVSQLEENG